MKISVNEQKNAPYGLLVCGAGPSGLMAALQAAKGGLSVLLLEKGPRCGRKLRLSGGGRGNFTHQATREELGFAYYEAASARFLRPAFSALDATDLVRFFERNGLPSRREDDGRVFPRSNSADDIAELMLRLCLEAGVRVLTNCPVQEAAFDAERRLFQLTFEKSAVLSAAVYGQTLILACGGASFRQTGSDGDGLRLAAAFGHRTLPFSGGLQALTLEEKDWDQLCGLSLPEVELRLSHGGGCATQKGAVLLTHQGLSGPAALNLSRWLADGAHKLELNLMPALSGAELESALLDYVRQHPRRRVLRLLSESLPVSLAKFLSHRLWGEQAEALRCAELNKNERRRLLQALQALPLNLGIQAAMDGAMVCRGGVALAEIRPRTMASRLCDGLYFAGEMIDVDGQSGGYNLQAAFSTGFLAGRSAAQAQEKQRRSSR